MIHDRTKPRQFAQDGRDVGELIGCREDFGDGVPLAQGAKRARHGRAKDEPAVRMDRERQPETEPHRVGGAFANARVDVVRFGIEPTHDAHDQISVRVGHRQQTGVVVRLLRRGDEDRAHDPCREQRRAHPRE